MVELNPAAQQSLVTLSSFGRGLCTPPNFPRYFFFSLSFSLPSFLQPFLLLLTWAFFHERRNDLSSQRKSSFIPALNGRAHITYLFFFPGASMSVLYRRSGERESERARERKTQIQSSTFESFHIDVADKVKPSFFLSPVLSAAISVLFASIASPLSPYPSLPFRYFALFCLSPVIYLNPPGTKSGKSGHQICILPNNTKIAGT